MCKESRDVVVMIWKVGDLQELVSELGFYLVDVGLDLLLFLQWDDEQGVIHVGHDVALEP